jgi:hypothetical protein
VGVSPGRSGWFGRARGSPKAAPVSPATARRAACPLSPIRANLAPPVSRDLSNGAGGLSLCDGGCCTNPRRGRWIVSKGGFRNRPSRPSRDGRPSRGRHTQPLWRPISAIAQQLPRDGFMQQPPWEEIAGRRGSDDPRRLQRLGKRACRRGFVDLHPPTLLRPGHQLRDVPRWVLE